MWGELFLPDPHNKETEWDLLLHQSRIPLEYMKLHVQSLQKFSDENQYVASD